MLAVDQVVPLLADGTPFDYDDGGIDDALRLLLILVMVMI